MLSLTFTLQRLGSLPTKLLLTILSLLLVFVGIFYFLNKQPQTAEAWYSSSWEHRRPISVGNTTGGALSNVDVLITLDTASLIAAGKMQSDCDDLRLVDSDDESLEILATSKTTLFSWDENLYISFEIRRDETIMELCSVTVFQIYDWDKNEENLADLLAELEDSLII